MKKLFLFLLTGLLFTSCSDSDESDENNGGGFETGYATGKVTDTQGNPIAGADILLDNALFYDSYLTDVSNEDGTYRIRVEPGAWFAYASFRKEYNGRVYPLELHPDDPNPLNEEGAIRNFNWKLEGRYNDDYSFYGGYIGYTYNVDLADNEFYENVENIKLTLTPSGPLIDGSEGQTLHLEFGDHYWVEDGKIEDIPIGRYIVTAVMQTENGNQPLRIQNWHTQGAFETELQLDFLSADDVNAIRGNSAQITIGY